VETMRLTASQLRQMIVEQIDGIWAKSQWSIRESAVQGRGTFTNQEMERNTRVARVARIRPDGHCVITAFGRLVNHRGLGNAELRLEGNSYWLYTTDRVPAGAELVSDYRDVPGLHFDRNTEGFTET